MKKKYLNDKVKKVPFDHKKEYCYNFSKHLDSLFQSLGHDNSDLKKLSIGDFFIEENEYDSEGEVYIAEKISDREINCFGLHIDEDVEKLYTRLKEVGR